MNEKSLDAIRKAIKFKYDGHIGKLLSIPNAHLQKVVPNQGIPSDDILKGFNRDSGKELQRYGEELLNEISRIIEKLKPTDFSETDKISIMEMVKEHCKPELYLKRYEIMLKSIERKLFSYGGKVNWVENIISLNKALCESYARNGTNRIKSRIENELDCLLEGYRSQTETSKSKVAETNDYFELKPNFYGLGINLNAIFAKIFGKKKT